MKNARPRRVFDRSVASARCRWEVLRRTSQYRIDVRNYLDHAAVCLTSSPLRLREYCLANGGVVDRIIGEEYDAVCRRYGLTVMMHPDVPLSDDEMAAFPVFADTPARQLKVRDRRLLRRVARRGGDVGSRTERRIFSKALVAQGPFQLPVTRVQLSRVDAMLAVFDAHVAGTPLAAIASDLGLSIDQAKRAWRTARALIKNWFDIESHLRQCAACQACVNGGRDRYCKPFEVQIGRQSARGVRTQAMDTRRLDLLHSRHKGELPARSSRRMSSPPSTSRFFASQR